MTVAQLNLSQDAIHKLTLGCTHFPSHLFCLPTADFADSDIQRCQSQLFWFVPPELHFACNANHPMSWEKGFNDPLGSQQVPDVALCAWCYFMCLFTNKYIHTNSSEIKINWKYQVAWLDRWHNLIVAVLFWCALFCVLVVTTMPCQLENWLFTGNPASIILFFGFFMSFTKHHHHVSPTLITQHYWDDPLLEYCKIKAQEQEIPPAICFCI